MCVAIAVVFSIFDIACSMCSGCCEFCTCRLTSSTVSSIISSIVLTGKYLFLANWNKKNIYIRIVSITILFSHSYLCMDRYVLIISTVYSKVIVVTRKKLSQCSGLRLFNSEAAMLFVAASLCFD